MVKLRIDPFPTLNDLNVLWLDAWGYPIAENLPDVLSRSLAHIGAYDDEQFIGFVNVAWDGGLHAFILDTCVASRMRGKGIASRMVIEATKVARERGAKWLHVDFEPHLTSFYRKCGFRPTEAGLIQFK